MQAWWSITCKSLWSQHKILYDTGKRSAKCHQKRGQVFTSNIPYFQPNFAHKPGNNFFFLSACVLMINKYKYKINDKGLHFWETRSALTYHVKTRRVKTRYAFLPLDHLPFVWLKWQWVLDTCVVPVCQLCRPKNPKKVIPILLITMIYFC